MDLSDIQEQVALLHPGDLALLRELTVFALGVTWENNDRTHRYEFKLQLAAIDAEIQKRFSGQ